jgi:hypothetical protein
LQAQHLVDASILRCPADLDPDSAGYDAYYILRRPRGDDSRPILVCPVHEDRGVSTPQPGVQAFGGRYTKQYPAVYATLNDVNNATVQEPGQDSIAGASGMILRGGDRVRTGPLGSAVITFTDGSRATLQGICDVTVLHSVLVSQVSGSTLYTIVRQIAGTAIYYVHHGSKFDVATPTATAGARGTRFRITITAAPAQNGNPAAPATELEVLDGSVAFNNARQGVMVIPGHPIRGLWDKLLDLL